jgi:cell division protein FtsQ
MKITAWPWKRILNFSIWMIVGIGFFVIWFFATMDQQQLKANAINFHIDHSIVKGFIQPNDINQIIHREGYDTLVGKSLSNIRFAALEQRLENNPWIRNAEIFADKNGSIAIHVQQRCPLMRIINKNNVGFYIDETGTLMQLSPKFTPRVIIVSGEINSSDFSSSNPTNGKRYDVVQLAQWLDKNPFWKAQITEIAVQANEEVKLYTLIGDFEIDFGKADDFENKFRKLKLFYTDGLNSLGWNRYKSVSVKFERQIVGVKK